MPATLRRAACGVGLLVSVCGCAGCSAGRSDPGLLRRDPLAAQRHNARGLTLLADGQLAEAQRAFELATQSDPYWGFPHNNLGVTLLRRGQFFDSAWRLRHACALMPKAAAPRANLGILYERVGKCAEAEESLREALKLAPDDVEIIGHLARVHVRQGKHTPDTVAWLRTVAGQDDDPAWRDWARGQLIRSTQTQNTQD